MKQPLNLLISDLMDSPKLLGPYFAGPSWDVWRAVLKASFAEKMSSADIAIFKEVGGGRNPPKHRVAEAIYAVGRGGGKDSVAALVATCLGVNFNPKGKLRPGEVATILCVAVSRDQGAIVANYIRAHFAEVPALRAQVERFTATGVVLKNKVEIVVGTNSFRSIRGKTFLACIFDEIAFWRAEDSAVPDVEVAAACAPGLARMPGSMSILISTVYKRGGLLYTRVKEHFGKDSDDALAVVGSTLRFNPTFDARTIERQIAEDPARFRAEYEGQWRDDLASYISRDLLESALDHGVFVRPPAPATRYYAFVDSSGGRHDSFTMAIAHAAKDRTIVLDLCYEKAPPFSPSETVREIAELLRSYRINQAVGDNFAAEFVVELFTKAGIRYIKSERDRSEIYANMLPLLTVGRARLIDNPRMVSQLASLERRTYPTGREEIRKGPGCRDDVANSCAGAMVLCAGQKAPLNITPELLEWASRPGPYSRRPRESLLGPPQPLHGTRGLGFRNRMKCFF